MTLAMPNPSGPVFELTPALRAEGLARSRLSPRRRMLLPIHREGGDLVQRMINFMQPGTYKASGSFDGFAVKGSRLSEGA